MEQFLNCEHEVDHYISYSSPDSWEDFFFQPQEEEMKQTERECIPEPVTRISSCKYLREEREFVPLEKRQRKLGIVKTPLVSRGTKNIPKNYANRIASFAISELAVPYLSERYGPYVSIAHFQEYIAERKAALTSITNFRELLQPDENDNDLQKLYKEMFQYVSIVFIKYFSVNWIFNSKLSYKEEHLKYRFKMLRRVKNPELFTYLKKW